MLLITDSSADYEQQELKDRDVICVPLAITFGNDTYLDGAELSKDDFYSRLLKREEFPFTSQPSPNDFLSHFLRAKEEKTAVLAILLSGGLSGTVQSAHIAKEMADYSEIYVVDSLSAVTGLRLLVDHAAAMRDAGMAAGEIAAEIEALKRRVHIFAAVDTLEYLHKGGRLTKGQARIGEMMRLKPIVSLDENGKLFVAEKALGRKKACKAIMAEMEKLPRDSRFPILLPYAHNKENALKFVELARKEYPAVSADNLYNLGPTIGTHTGDNVFGVTYVTR